MKRIIGLILILYMICVSGHLVAQNDIVIGGGSDIGAILCEGKVYTWGRGKESPVLVDFPVGSGTIKQVSAGSGSHFLALDCDGKVYSWGTNDRGQVGNGTTADQATPVLVQGINGVGTLSGVESVAGGTNTSFAILKTGELVSWGYNTMGQLGNGSIGSGATTSQTSPNYVVSAPGTHLQGVKQVLAGDAATYALLKDGTVVSWGSTGTTTAGWGLLGRNLNGSPGNPGATLEVGSDPFARPVYLDATKKLSGIVNIGAGDVFAMALAGDGHVYSWGHDSWGGSTGTSNCASPGNGNGADFTNPKLVTAGAAKGTAGDDGSGNLLAISIAAGRGFAMAVTAEGKPVAWGNNKADADATPCTEASGGCLGNGSSQKQSCYPQYILSGGTSHKDVVSITRGDTWGYYIRADGSIYAFGANEGGKLGIGNSNTQTSAVLFPPKCTPHFKPTAKISPRDTTVCAEVPFSISLDAGFKIGNSAGYTITWYKNDVPITGYPDLITAKGQKLIAKDTGEYKVRISYTGSNKPCGELDAIDSIKIKGFKRKFDIPPAGPAVNYPISGVTFCKKTDAWVIGSGRYAWYKEETGGLPIATTNQKERLQLPVSNFNSPIAGKLTVYVEETGEEVGKVGPKTRPCAGDRLTGSDKTKYNTIFTVSKTSVIDTVSLFEFILKNTSGTSSYTVEVYPTIVNANGKYLRDATAPAIAVSPVASFSKPSSPQDKDTLRSIYAGIKVPPGTYALSINTTAVIYKYEQGGCGSATYKDNLSEHAVTIETYDQNGNQANAGYGAPSFNWTFHTVPGFCKRIPVILGQDCPCSPPTALTITSAPASSGNPRIVTLCQASGTLTTLSVGTFTPVANPINGYQYVWYKKGEALPAYKVLATGTTPPAQSLMAGDSGTWVLRVEDGNNSVPTCYKEDSIKLVVKSLPTFTTKPGLSCGSSISLDTLVQDLFPANSSLEFYKDTLPPATINKVVTTAGTYYIKAKGPAPSSCETRSFRYGAVNVTFNTAPVITKQPIDGGGCVGSSATLAVTATGTAAINYQWKKAGTNVGTNSPTFTVNPLAESDKGTYNVTVSNSCGSVVSDDAKIDITLNETPEVSLTASKSSVCQDSSVVLTAVGKGGTNQTFTFNNNGIVIGNADQTSTLTTTGLTAASNSFTVEMKFTSGCLAPGVTSPVISTTPAVVTTVAKPQAVITGFSGTPKEKSISVDSIQLTAQAITSAYTGTWTTKAGQQGTIDNTGKLKGLTNFESPSTLGQGTTLVYWSVRENTGVCPAAKDSATVIKRNVTIPEAGNDTTICATYNAFSRKGNGDKTLPAPTETYDWIVPAAGTGNMSASDKNVLDIPAGLAPGTYKYYFHTYNDVAKKDSRDSFQLKIIAPPLANIIDPTAAAAGDPKLKNISTDTTSVTATAVGTGYKGTWSISKGQGQIDTLGKVTLLIEKDPKPEATTVVVWTVTEKTGVCPVQKDSALIIKRDYIFPNLGPDTVKCQSSLPFTRKTNLGSKTMFQTVTWTPNTWIVNDQDIVVPANTAPGVYIIEASVETVIGKGKTINSAKLVIRIDSVSAKPALTENTHGLTSADPYFICSFDYQLPGKPNPQAKPLAQSWWTVISGPATLPPAVTSVDSVTPTLKVSADNLLIKTLYTYKNGVCPPDTTPFYITKVGNLTPAEVSIDGGATKIYSNQNLTSTKLADTLCVRQSYVLNALLAPKADETGSWIVRNGNSVAITEADSNATSNSLVVRDTGRTTLVWKIRSNIISTCNPNILTFDLVVHQKPQGGLIQGGNSICEGTDTTFKIKEAMPPSTLPVTYTWGAGIDGAKRTGDSTGLQTTYQLKSNQLGDVTQGTITAGARNRCGDTVLNKKILAIRLAPREFIPGDTINGPKAFCSTNKFVKYKMDRLQPNTEQFGYVWSWSPAGSGKQVLPADNDTAAFFTGWDSTKSQTIFVKLELQNKCSANAKKAGIIPIDSTIEVDIIAPQPIRVLLSSDKKDNNFCEPDDNVIVTAKADTKLPGFIGKYSFSYNGGPVLATDSVFPYQYTFAQRLLKDLDKVQVHLEAAPNQCITKYTADTSLVMNGYQYADSTILLNADSICDTDPDITLKVIKSRNTAGSSWILNDTTDLISWENTYQHSLGTPAESGMYVIEATSSVCTEHISKDTVWVKIYEQPEASFSTDLLLIDYTPGMEVPLPLVFTPTKFDSVYATYSPDTWLKDPTDRNAVIVPRNEEKEILYGLHLSTRDVKGKEYCQLDREIKVINSLPVSVPNAFSPNGDGLNDTWVIKGLGKYRNTHVKIFNRWGNSMFTDFDGYQVTWDGTHSGIPLAAGTYYYVIELRGSIDNTDRDITGHLTIIR